MSPVSLILLSLAWSAALWIGASLLCRLTPTPHQAQAIWRVAAGLMILPFLAAPILPDIGAGIGAAIPDLPAMDVLTVNPGEVAPALPVTRFMPSWLTLDRFVLFVLVIGWASRGLAWLVGQSRLQSLKRKAQSSRLSAATWARALGLSAAPEVRLTPSGSPFVAGLARPVVYLPHDLQSCAEVQQVIAHECVHLKRGDLIARPVERIVSDLFWFSPFTWGMRGALDYWREAVVDTEAVQLTGDRIAYARALTHTARLSRPIIHLPVAAFILPRKGTLKMRLTNVLHTRSHRPGRLAFSTIAALMVAVPVALAQGAMIKPNIAPVAVYSHAVLDKAKLTSQFGERKHPITRQSAFHKGVDLAEEEGKPVYAPADGMVVFAGEKGDYGNIIDLQVASDTQLRFAQLSEIGVTAADPVKAGDIIGRIGQSGAATGPHLHLELWQAGEPTDPAAAAGLVLANVLRDTTGRSVAASPEAATATAQSSSACSKFNTWFRDTPTPDIWTARLVEAKTANAARGVANPDKSVAPQQTDYPQPVYPQSAAAEGRMGACQVLFDISPEGLPLNVQADCSDPVFAEAARAMPGAKFEPAMVDGKPVTLKGVFYPLLFCIE